MEEALVMDTATFMSIKHGTLSSYNKGCRCEVCRHNMSAYQAGRRASNGTYSMKGIDQSIDELLDVMVELGMADYA